MRTYFYTFIPAVMLLASCCFSTEETVCVAIPHEEGAAWCDIVWTDGNNAEHTERFLLDEAGAEKRIALTVTKNGCTPVLARFYDSGMRAAGTPYGMILPHTTVLSRADGFCAEILRALYASAQDGSPRQVQDYLARFNWSRFMETCRTYDNPWLLDKERIMCAIASGSFRKSDIRLRAPDD